MHAGSWPQSHALVPACTRAVPKYRIAASRSANATAKRVSRNLRLARAGSLTASLHDEIDQAPRHVHDLRDFATLHPRGDGGLRGRLDRRRSSVARHEDLAAQL